ncbi:helix-turn-helix domain-containing protein [Sphingobacterium sp. Lzh-3]|uniref:helix-turn-helix domain-containing protein n=1 Tax=Sphingobacterium sp. Lzh-3 TaxID=3382150 RepID=UPI00398D67E6
MKPHLFTSIGTLLSALDLPEPLHPLVTVVESVHLVESGKKLPEKFMLDFYIISYKNDPTGKLKYGQHYYEFEKGTMLFLAPRQLLAAENNLQHAGYSILIHPDFLRGFSLDNIAKKFGFFAYSVHEALRPTESEQTILVNIYETLVGEMKSKFDDSSPIIIITLLELLLNYCDRFYKRQFVTQQAAEGDLLARVEKLLNDYFDKETGLQNGLPTVKYLAEQLHYSSSYLSDMLRSLTGESAQLHIQNMMIEKAKELLSTSNLSVAEIAYQLGFERPQSFNKLFRKKVEISPLQFRRSFD